MIFTKEDFKTMLDSVREEMGDKAVKKAIAFYYGEQIAYMLARYGKIFDNFDDIKDQIPMRVMPITKKIVNALSLLYKTEPVRTVLVNNVPDKNATKLYNDIILKAGKANKMKTIDSFTRLLQTTIMQVYYSDKKQSLKYRVLTKDNTGVVPNDIDPQEIEAIVYRMQVVDPDDITTTTDRYMYWTEQDVRILDEYGEEYYDRVPKKSANGEFELVKVNPESKNPYGIIPFIACRNADYIGDDFWAPLDETLININEAINQIMTELLTAINFQAFSQPYVTGISDKSDIEMSRLQLITLPDIDSKLLYASPDSHIPEILETLEKYVNLSMYLMNLGLNSTSTQGYLTSGFAIMASKLDMLDDRATRMSNFRESEQSLYEVEKRVWNYHAKIAGLELLPEDSTLRVDFTEAVFPKSVDEQIAMEVHELSTNQKTGGQLMFDKDPDLGNSEMAEKQLAKNAEINNKANSRFVIKTEPIENEEI